MVSMQSLARHCSFQDFLPFIGSPVNRMIIIVIMPSLKSWELLWFLVEIMSAASEVLAFIDGKNSLNLYETTEGEGMRRWRETRFSHGYTCSTSCSLGGITISSSISRPTL